jgi:hypothetical protein
MKVIIAGSRSITNYALLRETIERSGYHITEVVSGTARGVDRMGERWAAEHNIPVKKFPADWSKHGKKAGFIRNQEMVNYADALVGIWDGQSNGMRDTMRRADAKEGMRCFVHIGR